MTKLEEALKKLKIEQLKKYQKEALTPENEYDIWLALSIESEIKSRRVS